MEGTRRRGGKSGYSYGRYLKRKLPLLTNSEMRLSKQSIQILDSMMNDIFCRLASQAAHLVYTRNKKTLTHRDMEFATKLVIPGQLGAHAVNEGQKAILLCKGHRPQDGGSLESLEYSAFTSNVRFHSSKLNSSSSTISTT